MGAARPARRVELADIVRSHGAAHREAHRLTRGQHRALRAIVACRTAALGGHTEAWEHCGALRIAYTSCRNRHCPKCQTLAKERWLAARRAALLPVEYFHVVFTLPHTLNPLAQGNPRVFYATCRATDWVVYAKPPFAGPAQVLEYLGRYTHRVAISNERLLSFDADQVRFRWKDYAHGTRVKTMTRSADEFLRRFLLHVLPAGFVRIRHVGLLANRTRTAKLARCRQLLAVPPAPPPGPPEAVATLLQRLTGVDLTRCPVCRTGRLRVVGLLRPGALPVPVWDTS